jgi:hypothetical protein
MVVVLVLVLMLVGAGTGTDAALMWHPAIHVLYHAQSRQPDAGVRGKAHAFVPPPCAQATTTRQFAGGSCFSRL